jgi:hypothetical protein
MLAEAGEDTVETPGRKRSRRVKNDRIDAVQAALTALAAQCVRTSSCTPQLEPGSMTGKASSGFASPACEPFQPSSGTHRTWAPSSVSSSSRALTSPASGAATTYMAILEDTRTFHHPEVGDLPLGHQSMALNGRPGQALIAH